MYLEFYGLSEKPFSQTPDPRFLYWNDAYRETLASLSYGIRERKGFIAMLGEAGTGKTTLLRKLLEDLGDEIISVFLFNPNASFEEILEYTLSELGITAPTGRKLAMLQRLNEFLLAAFAEGRNTILLIDEAQDLEPDVLESLRLLSNLETSQEKILQIVLSGQPELADKLADPGLRQLKQRIAVRCRLEPLRREELESFIRARLAVAGGSPDIFAPDAFDPIWRFTNGIPRLVNTACDNALLVGYALGRRILDRGVIEEVIRDLENLDIGVAGPRKTVVEPAAGAAATAPEPASVEPAVAPTPEPAPPATTAASTGAPARTVETPIRAKRPIAPAHADTAPGRSSLPWMMAALLAGLVLLLAGAWLGRVGVPAAVIAKDGSASLAPAERAAEGSADSAESASVESPSEPPADPAASTREGAREAGAAPAEAEPGAHEPSDRTVQEDQAAGPPMTEPPPAAEVPPSPQTSEVEPAEAAPGDRADAPGTGAVPPPPAPEPEKEAEATAEPRNVAPADRAPPERVASLAPAELPIPLQAGRRSAPASGSSGSTGSSAPRKEVPVARGDTLHELAARRYGSSNLTTLDMLRAANPQIRNIDLIIAGSGLVFPDPGPESRVLRQDDGFAVLAVTTPTLSNALAVQSSLEDRLEKPVSLERVEGEGRTNLYRVSVRGIGDHGEAVDIAEQLGPILRDPTP